MGAHDQGADATAGRWLVIPRTLCFVVNGDDVLLMKRSPHKRVFPNKYNGLGGHIERDEDPLNGARREIMEESGLAISDIQLRAVHHIDAGASTGIMLFIFVASSTDREITVSSDEGTLHWVSRSELGELDLVEDLLLLLPRILDMRSTDTPLLGYVSYDDQDQIQLHYSNG